MSLFPASQNPITREKITQVEVPDRKSICPDRNERTRWPRAFKITRSGKK